MGKPVLEIGVKVGTSGSVKSLADLEKQSKKTFDAMSKNAKKAGKGTSDAFDSSKKSTKAFTDQISSATPHMGRFGGFIGKITRGVKTMNPVLMAGALAVGVFVGSVTAGVKEFKTFEKTMSNVKALVRPTATEFGLLSEQARKLGMSTAFTADQAGQAFTELGKLGFDTNQIIASSADVLNLAAAANTDMATAALATAKTLNQFNLAADEAGRVTDIIALASASSAIDIFSFSEAMKIAGATSKGFGVSIEESTAVISAMSNAGLEGTMAGTGFSQMLIEMGREGSKSNLLLKKLGLEQGTLTEKVVGLKDAGLDAGQMFEVFGMRAARSALAVINNADEIARLGLEYQSAGGAAQLMADTQLDNLDGSLKLLSSAFSEVKLKIGEAFSPSVRGSVDLLTESLTLLNFQLGKGDIEQRRIELERRTINLTKQKKIVDDLTAAQQTQSKLERASWMTEGQWNDRLETQRIIEVADKKELADAEKELARLIRLTREEAGLGPKGGPKKTKSEQALIDEANQRAETARILKKEKDARELEALTKLRIQTTDKWNLFQLNSLEDSLDTRLQKIELQKKKELRILSEEFEAGKLGDKTTKETVEKKKLITESIETTATKKTVEAKKTDTADEKKLLDEKKALLLEFNGFKISLTSDGIDKEAALIDAKYDAEIEKLRGFLDDKLITQKESDVLEAELEAQKIAEKEELEDKYLEDRLAKFNSHFQLIGGLSQDLLQGTFDFANATDSARLKKMKDQNKKELKNTSLSESQKQKLQEKFDAEEEVLERKIFERKKKQSVANALIQGALAVANVWGTWAATPPVAITLSALAGTMVGLNVAAIASQEFADGGAVDGFGTPSSRGPDNRIVRVRSGERILNALQQSRLDDILFGSGGNVSNQGSSSPSIQYTGGDIIIQSDKVSDEDLDRIRETQDQELFKFKDLYETLQASGEIQ